MEFDFEEVEGVHAKHGDRARAYACKSVVLWRERVGELFRGRKKIEVARDDGDVQ